MHILDFQKLNYIIDIITETSETVALLKQVECNLTQHELLLLLLDPAFVENPQCYFTTNDVLGLKSDSFFLSLSFLFLSLFPSITTLFTI